MRILCLPNNQLFQYVLTGKFKAPSPEWKHETFFLSEYELFVMTEGTLYLHYNNEDFTVSSGEYLLLPPCNSWRQGFKEAYCSFYWLHFAIVIPPPRKKFLFSCLYTRCGIYRFGIHHSTDGQAAQVGENRGVNETVTGHGEKQIPRYRSERYVHHYHDRVVRATYPTAAC